MADTKTYNRELQAKLEDYISEVGSQNKAASALGISSSVISQYRQSKYSGDIEALENRLAEMFANKEEAKALYKVGDYAPTTVSKGVYQTIRICHLKGGLAVEAGDAGIGKTMAAQQYIKDYPNTSIYIAINPCTSNVTAFLKAFARALHIDVSGRKDDMWARINETLKGSKKVLIIDESQHLPIKTIETIRSFSDNNKDLGICLIGNLESLCNNGKAGYAQIRNRTKLTNTRHTYNITLEDIELLFPNIDKKSAEFLHKITQTEQAVRGASNLYSNAADNQNTSYEGLIAMAKATRVLVN
ncbi:MAG: AAA family ATPase [Clostridia bacterium]|nr:AAA family ATPase [Clostridia bacterium]